MDLRRILSLKHFQDLLSQIEHNQVPQNLGLARAARLPVVAALQASLQIPVLLITDRADRVLTQLDELGFWAASGVDILHFPEPVPLFYEKSPWGPNVRRERLITLTRLASAQIPGAPRSERPPLILASARAMLTRTLPKRDFVKACKLVKPGQRVQPDALIRTWLSMGYTSTSIVIEPGQFARRGGLLDIWPLAESTPARLDFFGDEIEKIRRFDPATQRTAAEVEKLMVSPARELLLPDGYTPPSDPEQIPDEFSIPLFHPVPASLIEYLPPRALVLIDDNQALEEMVHTIEEQAVRMRSDAVKNGSLPADYPLPYLTWPALQDAIESRPNLALGPFSAIDPGDEAQPAATLRDCFTPAPRFGGRLKPLLEQVGERLLAGEHITLVSRQSQRLEELWADVAPTALRESSQETGLRFLSHSLSEGWLLSGETVTGEQIDWTLLTDGEIFGWQRPQPRQRPRPTAQDPEAAYADLQTGDLVVHVDHGIGIFMGMVQRSVEGSQTEYLVLEYAEGDQLFVPVYQADRITRYVGADARNPNLTRLGGAEWRNTKGKVKEAVEEVAQDLLELYATRQIVPGFAFAADGHWQQELEASFPYVETEDQLRVLTEVKHDMEASRPMDRLICGDVGYGKTEIALRAAFKAVMNSKQVLMLVPTTVLAQQHFNTFRERLTAFPVTVEMLSRFRTPQEQTEILRRLNDGKVDILIGTHRLLSGDVQPRDLGLLIIDEEQRFGVTHKEALKQMRTEVDVLTLTATPIPRTLYMALTGVRDISTLNTPPAERLPIVTHVGPFNPPTVRQAILRELERGGQVFFVHNRVQTIYGMRQHLEKLVPEARVTVAHGQMNEHELSARMREFTEGEVDILLSTSIIESGLDIPNANTLIVDRADTFGLAQLYQLRGRVGRGAQRAYAYFFRHAKRPPTDDGRQRLETIAENTQLGAGFSIAMRDLEIRGAGDLLGMRQHGHIAAVGFHLYTRLLGEAVRRMQSDLDIRPVNGKPAGLSGIFPGFTDASLPQVSVDLPISVSLPANYIADKHVRLRLYRRMAELRNLGEVDALAAEFKDRFGPLPEETLNLFFQLKVRLMAEQAGVNSVSAENGLIAIRYPPLPDGAPGRRFPPFGPEMRVGKNGLWFDYRKAGDWRAKLTSLLETLKP